MSNLMNKKRNKTIVPLCMSKARQCSMLQQLVQLGLSERCQIRALEAMDSASQLAMGFKEAAFILHKGRTK